MLDVYGTDHDPALWQDPERFDPDRLADGVQTFALLAQGGGEPRNGPPLPRRVRSRA